MIIMLKSGNGQNFFITANSLVVIKRVDCSFIFVIDQNRC